MPKQESSIEDQIKEAIQEVEVAMLENMSAGRAEVESKIKKEKARFRLLKAQERLTSLYHSFM